MDIETQYRFDTRHFHGVTREWTFGCYYGTVDEAASAVDRTIRAPFCPYTAGRVVVRVQRVENGLMHGTESETVVYTRTSKEAKK